MSLVKTILLTISLMFLGFSGYAGGISLSVNGQPWNVDMKYGTIVTTQNEYIPHGGWTITGSSDGEEDIEISVVEGTGKWLASEDGVSGVNKFGLKGINNSQPITDVPRIMKRLEKSETYKLDLSLAAPAQGSETGQHQLTIKLTAKNYTRSIRMYAVSLSYSYNGQQAESYCSSTYGAGWHLFVPRSQAHLKEAWDFVNHDAQYLFIMGIYPKYNGANCIYKAMKSGACTEWKASDDGQFWVSDRTNISEPNSDSYTGCSMGYSWNNDGTSNWYNDNYCNYYSNKFICSCE